MRGDNDLLGFGSKYPQVKMKDVPATYLLELRNNKDRYKRLPSDVLDYIEDNIDRIAEEAGINELDIYQEGLDVEDAIDEL